MDEERQPTTEQRIKAAMALAGLDWDSLADRIGTPGYGAKTLKNMADPNNTTTRAPTDTDLLVIGSACGVSNAFWTVDFSALGVDQPLRAKFSALEERFDALAAETAAQMAAQMVQQERALQEHRETDHQGQAGEGEAR